MIEPWKPLLSLVLVVTSITVLKIAFSVTELRQGMQTYINNVVVMDSYGLMHAKLFLSLSLIYKSYCGISYFEEYLLILNILNTFRDLLENVCATPFSFKRLMHVFSWNSDFIFCRFVIELYILTNFFKWKMLVETCQNDHELNTKCL